MHGIQDVNDRLPKDDGFWAVRWIDHFGIGPGETPSPMMDVQLVQLPCAPSLLDPRQAAEALTAPNTANLCTVRMKAGFLPNMYIGACFQNGAAAGALSLTESSFVTDLGKNPTTPQPSLEICPDRPSWWDSKLPYRFLNSKEYPLTGFEGSYCAPARCAQGLAIIPCAEILRTLYGCHQMIILALLSGPWDKTWPAVANPDPERTWVSEQGEWHIGLRRGIKKEFASWLANAIHHPYGSAQARAIYASLLSENRKGYLKANIPFDSSNFGFKAKVIPLRRGVSKFLVTQITGMTWPFENQIIHPWLDNDNTQGETRKSTNAPRPYSGGRATIITDKDGRITATSEEEPTYAAETQNFATSGVVLINPPTFVRIKKEESHTYEGGKSSRNDETLATLSPGHPHAGLSDAAHMQYSGQEQRDPSTRFSEVREMLESLEASRQIDGWAVYPPERPHHYDGPYPVWRINPVAVSLRPKRFGRWAYLNASLGIPRRVMICTIATNTQQVLWIEIELTEKESGKRSLIFKPRAPHNPSDVNATITELLKICAKYRGNWPNEQEIEQLLSIPSVQSWRHHYGEDDALNPQSALKKIVAAATEEQHKQIPQHRTATRR